MLLLEAKPVRERILAEVHRRASAFRASRGRAPSLRVVLVGNDPASEVYVRNKASTAAAHGVDAQTIRFESNIAADKLRAAVEKLNDDPSVDGILIQRPLPVLASGDDSLCEWVSPEKDVDGFHPTNLGNLVLGRPGFVPCTPSGILALLKHYQVPISGSVACVVGRSPIVGRPMAALLVNESATVLTAHSRTKDLARWTAQADLLIVAAGKPGLITGQHIKPGAVVVDVGIHRDSSGTLRGDVDFESASRVASALTPVPGGVGPMTIALLLHNTLLAARA